MRLKVLFLAGLMLLALAAPRVSLLAQGTEPTPIFGGETDNPNATITWPPPVYVVRGELEIRGSANLPDQLNYFLEFRPLNESLGFDENIPWFPASLPSNAAVQDDILGVWNTETAPDGVYALRLTINTRGGTPTNIITGPVRVENEPSPFAQPTAVDQPVIPTEPPPPAPATAAPQPTVDNTPRVTANLDANIRSGDNTQYPAFTALEGGESAVIVGISPNSGWYQIRLDDGRIGWISNTVVTVSGDTANLPRVQPPPPPVTPTPTLTPTPIATATPVSAVNLVAGNVYLSDTPRCNEEFTVGIDVANLGSVAAPGSRLLVQDIRAADGSVQISRTADIPALNPGVTDRIEVNMLVPTWFGEAHRLVLTVDYQNVVNESNEGDNAKVLEYILDPAECDG